MSTVEHPVCALEPRLRRAAALGELTAALAHELSNVHMVATGNLELLLASEGATAGSSGTLAKSRDAIWRGAEILRTLMALTSVEEPGGGASFAGVLGQVRVLLASRLARQGLRIDEDLEPAPPVDVEPVQLGLGLYGLLLGLSELGRRAVLRVSSRCEGKQLRCELAIAGSAELVARLAAETPLPDDAALGRVDAGLARRCLLAAGCQLDSDGGGRLVLRLPLRG